MYSWLYHSDCHEGRIFTSEEQYAEAIHNGWVDSPAKIGEPAKPVKVDIPVSEKPVSTKKVGLSKRTMADITREAKRKR